MSKKTHDLTLLVIIGILIVACAPALAECEVAKLLASDGAAADWFGLSVSISGDAAVVGAYGGGGAGEPAGSAYIYRLDPGPPEDWVEETELLPSDGTLGDGFGYYVAICGDIAVIGAPYDDENGFFAGSAYVYRFDPGPPGNWVEEAKLLPDGPEVPHHFGWTVAVRGETVVIGTFGTGAYVFHFEGGNWVQQAELIGSDTVSGDIFGLSVAIYGDTAVVGAYRDDNDNGVDAGSAYVFCFDPGPPGSWTEQAKLTASNGAAYDYTGYCVSISGDTAVVSSHGVGGRTGAAYIFEKPTGGWEDMTETATLTASDGAASDYFGLTVSISGDTAVAGACEDDDNGDASGSAYVFEKPIGGWQDLTETVKITASDGAAGDYFGISVSVSADNAVIGAPIDDDNGNESGSAYVFHLPDCIGCPGDVDGDGDTDLSDLAALLAAYGSTTGDPSYNPDADFDGDGDVDLSDLAFLLADYGCTITP